jgi:hypothetical protein
MKRTNTPSILYIEMSTVWGKEGYRFGHKRRVAVDNYYLVSTKKEM